MTPDAYDQPRTVYELESRLASRLRDSSAQERLDLYGEVYEAFYRELPAGAKAQRISEQERAVHAQQCAVLPRRYLTADKVVLELGAGDCAVSCELSKHAAKVFAVEASATVSSGEFPKNVHKLQARGVGIALPDLSVDLIYSDNFIEHVHPDDLVAHIRECARVLRPGGYYVCITPNRLSGPHDASKHFSLEPQGFHLREYMMEELQQYFADEGFVLDTTFVRARGRLRALPAWMLRGYERLLSGLPRRAQWRITRLGIGTYLLPNTIVVRKPG